MIHIHKYRDRKGGHRWNVRAVNGRIITTGAEAYTSAAMRNKGLQILLTAVKNDDFEIITDPVKRRD